jgi:hypothetical protein
MKYRAPRSSRHVLNYAPQRAPINPHQREASAAIRAYMRELKNLPELPPALPPDLLRGISALPLRVERGGLIYNAETGVSEWRDDALTAVLFEREDLSQK